MALSTSSLMVAEAFFGLSARPPMQKVKRSLFPTSVLCSCLLLFQDSKTREIRYDNTETTILGDRIDTLAPPLSMQHNRICSRS
jgi:hypothetical protein